MNTPRLLAAWSWDFSPLARRRENARRIIRLNLQARPPGAGNRFWRRYCDTQRARPVLIWPDYALNPIPYRP